MRNDRRHEWYFQKKWLTQAPAQMGTYVSINVLLVVISLGILYREPLPHPFLVEGSCSDPVFPLIALQAAVLVLLVILFVFLLWKAEDTAHIKTELKLTLFVAFPTFIFWAIVSLYPSLFPPNFDGGFLVMGLIFVSFLFCAREASFDLY